MEIKKQFWPLLLGLFLIIAFLISIFWIKPIGLLLLTLIIIAIFLWSFVNPQLAVIALIVVRTAIDFLTDQEIFSLGQLSINFTSLVGLLVIILAIIIFIREKCWQRKPPLFWNWLLFLGMAIILSIFSINLTISVVEIFRWLSFLALFILGFLLFPGGQKTTLLIKTLIFSSLIPLIISIFQIINQQGFFDGERWRIAGTFVHPNMLAFYLVFVITLVLFIFLTLRQEAIEKYFYLIFSLPLLIVLLFTYTRGAWLCLILILFLVGLSRFRVFLLSTLLILFLFYISFLPFQERVNSLASFSASDSTVWRLDLWRDAWGYAKNSLIVGHGPGTASLVIGQNRSHLLGSSEPHNDYIKIILETGLIGLAAYVFLILSLWWKLWQGYLHEKWPRRKLLFLFMLIFSIALYLSSAGDNILKDSSLQWSFWALIGALMHSYYRIQKDKGDLVV